MSRVNTVCHSTECHYEINPNLRCLWQSWNVAAECLHAVIVRSVVVLLALQPVHITKLSESLHRELARQKKFKELH